MPLLRVYIARCHLEKSGVYDDCDNGGINLRYLPRQNFMLRKMFYLLLKESMLNEFFEYEIHCWSMILFFL